MGALFEGTIFRVETVWKRFGRGRRMPSSTVEESVPDLLVMLRAVDALVRPVLHLVYVGLFFRC
jgi:hypothetical protein